MLRLKSIREAAGMTQQELAWRARISESYLSRVESGKQIPGLDRAMRIADVLDVSLDELAREHDADGTPGSAAEGHPNDQSAVAPVGGHR